VFEYLEGQVAEHSAARLVLDVGGVGYDLRVPVGSLFARERRVRVWTHMVVREDDQYLCGFADRPTRELFRLLISVRGVGPVMALGILSGLPPGPLTKAIAQGDLAALTRIRGVGKKTAEQIVLDLREKAAKLAIQSPGSVIDGVVHPPARSDVALDDAIAALISIGYSEKEAKKSVERAATKVGAQDLETLVRTALSG
jgi:Holliday junction DNA helicase RuvA